MRFLNLLKKLNGRKSRFLLLLISFLGFGGCQKHNDDVVALYGVMMPAHTFKGVVSSNAEPSSAIPGIKVVISDSSRTNLLDSTYTNSNGFYNLNDMNKPYIYNTYTLHFEDVDGTANGGYKSKDTTVTLPGNIIDYIEIIINVKLDSK